MGQGKYLWSKTAGNNAGADGSINWAEGMAPSAINDSARAQMAREAEWRDDISGTITTGGTSTAYTVASNQVFDTLAHMSGAMIAFIPHATSGATVTLNVDGLGAKPLRSSPGVDLPAGVLVQGTPYTATFNNSDGAFYLRNFYVLPYVVPVGAMLDYTGASAPNSNFVLPCGQNISRTVYATYFGIVGTTYGAGDGSTTFGLPDLRGRTTFGKDDMGGSAASRITVAGGNFDGTVLGGTGGAQNHTLTTNELPSHGHPVTITDPGHSHVISAPIVNNSFLVNTASNVFALQAQSAGNTYSSNSASTGITAAAANIGGNAAHPVLSPAIIVTKILRVI